MTDVLAHEQQAISDAQDGRVVCLWRTTVPIWRVGRAYSTGAGRMTVIVLQQVLVRSIKLKDVKRSGFKNFAEVMEQLRTWEPDVDETTAIWEARVQPGDLRDYPRLLQHSARKSGDYTSRTDRAMRGSADPGEAPSDAQLAEIVHQGHWDRDALEEQFKARVAQEAQTLFRGNDSLRNFQRVLDNLGADAPGRRRRAS